MAGLPHGDRPGGAGLRGPDPGLLRSALEVLPMGVVLRDRSGAEVLRNTAASRLTGDYQADALVRSAIDEVFTAAESGRWDPEIVEVHGPTTWIFSVWPQQLEGGRAVFVEDMSERQRLDRIKRDFVANVSHELRTPVGAIVLLSETLQEESNPGAVALLQSHIAEEARRARRLVDSLLVLSRVEVLRPDTGTRVDLATVAADALAVVRPIAAESGIELELDLSSPAPVVAGDAESLVSAVANLLENAVKYSDGASPVTLQVSVRGAEACLSVVDSGIGIPAKDVDRIFERFYRVDRARSRGTGGAGLGLAIVRHVVENHGGRVGVESREGEGSTFTLTLPLAGEDGA